MTEEYYSKNVEAIRSFTRFYTKKAGVLNEQLLQSKFGLTEARILYELSARQKVSAKDLAYDLELDPAYISRVFKKFEKLGYISRAASLEDKRKYDICLTKKGQAEYNILDRRSASLFNDLIQNINDGEQAKLLSAMNVIQNLLEKPETKLSPYLIRPHRSGDMGWIIGAHGSIYTAEYGWDDTFEAMVAEIASNFLRNFIPKSECCWIAEQEGRQIGSAMIVREDEEVAKLRLVIVDPSARGLGVGVRLVEECINFSKRAGYSKLILWTYDNLHAAIAVYKKLGFTLDGEELDHSFGKDLVGQIWSLDLTV